MKKKILDSSIIIVLLIVIILGVYIIYENYYNVETVKIANWNLHTFGEAKSSNSELMQIYSSVIDDYDIIFLQEIRDKSGESFQKLCSMLENYSCLVSSRAGRSSNKEQYGIVYKQNINITELYDYNPDKQDRWERPPIKATFEINDYKLTIYNIHTKPEDAQRELSHLEDIIINSWKIVVLGDLNADCSYYDNRQQKEFNDWRWVIDDRKDTTTAPTNCAYDRIILNSDAFREYRTSGVYKKDITKEVSDHYPVWVKLKIQ